MNIAVLSCKNIKDETCLGCHRCLIGFDRKEGEFERHKGKDTKLRAYSTVEDAQGHHRFFD